MKWVSSTNRWWDGLSSDKLAALAGNSSNLSNVYYASHFSTLSDDADVQAFVKAYKEKYGANPDTFAALSYDATYSIVNESYRKSRLN